MATITITSLAYDPDRVKFVLGCDFSALTLADPDHAPAFIDVPVAAVGDRVAQNGYADGDTALTGIVLEHAARLASDAAGATVDWQSPSDEEKAAQLNAQADAIEAARVFFGGTP